MPSIVRGHGTSPAPGPGPEPSPGLVPGGIRGTNWGAVPAGVAGQVSAGAAGRNPDPVSGGTAGWDPGPVSGGSAGRNPGTTSACAGGVAADPGWLAAGSVRSIYQRVMDRARNDREYTTGHPERFRILAPAQFTRVAALVWTRRRCPATVR